MVLLDGKTAVVVLDGRTAVVTGDSSGIERGITLDRSSDSAEAVRGGWTRWQ